MSRSVWGVVGCGVLTASPISGAQATPSSFIVMDSVGIRVVSSEYPDTLVSPIWEFPELADLSIGTEEGGDEYLLHRVGPVIRLDDGRILVSNGGTELRLFDAGGTYLKTIGQEGDGPGEFRDISAVRLSGRDAVIVADRWSHRVTRVGLDGNLEATYRTAGPSVEGLLDGERAVGTTGGGWSPAKQGRVGYAATEVRVHLVDVTTGFEDTLAVLPGPSWWASQGRGGALQSRPVPWTTMTVFAVGRDRIAVAWTGKSEVRVHDATGAVDRIVRWSQDPEHVSAEDVEDLIQRAPVESRRDYGRIPLPDTKPMFGRVLLDDANVIWVGMNERRPDGRRRWIVFNRGGVAEGYVDTPPRVRVRSISSGYLVGVEVDDLGVERVVVFKMKGRSGRAPTSTYEDGPLLEPRAGSGPSGHPRGAGGVENPETKRLCAGAARSFLQVAGGRDRRTSAAIR